MYKTVEEHNIYRWAAAFITKLAATRVAEAAGGFGAVSPGQPGL